MLPGLEKRSLTSFDGTELCYYTSGSGPAVVLGNGLGGPVGSYHHVLAELGQEHKVLSWDYRGGYGSGRPNNSADLSIDHHTGFGTPDAGVGAWQGLVSLMKRAGLVANSLDMDVFRGIVKDFANMDMEMYCETLSQLRYEGSGDTEKLS